ncbi:S-layer homology domain-containing protein [Virgibacillus halodenitrificans]|uniref:S-layer homology domain-containing protein n=1 Tax=Virgibacillus halodenitrificans TaxID=1482 RepID=UPI0013CF04BC|nr:S-layer homology domain-containing protein [Virgibacillus halodenitrificans]
MQYKQKKITSRKAVATTLVAGAALTPVSAVIAAETKEYKDVTPDSSHYEAIMHLTEKEVIKGYPDGSFQQWNTISRQHVAVILFNVLDLEVPENPEEILKAYSDVETGDLYANEIAAVTAAGVFKGSDGSFDPEGDISREQLATVLQTAFHLSDYYTNVNDVDINLENVDDSHKERVQTLANLKITNQFEDFKPAASISRGAFSTMIYLALKTIDSPKIHHLQGESHYSPFDGKEVNNVEGIVTYTYEMYGNHYFHLQQAEDTYDDNPKTSEAIIVFTGKEKLVNIGDSVTVDGKVAEYAIDGYSSRHETDLPITEIDIKNGSVAVEKENVELPEPLTLTSSNIPGKIADETTFEVFDPTSYAIDYWESMEGMRVKVDSPKAIAPQEHGDLFTVTKEYETNTINGGLLLKESGPNAQTIPFKLHPNNDARDFDVKTGDYFEGDVTGVVNYGYSNYKVYANLSDMKEMYRDGGTKQEASEITKDPAKLTVASYNVENFSANTDDRETPESKAKRIAEAFVNDMENPDIIGITEVQDNNGQADGPNDADASESFERLIALIKEVGGPTYEYVNINPEYNADGGAPNANIRVGFLYNPERVSLKEGMPKGDANDAVAYVDGKLTLNPGRIQPNNPVFDDTRKSLAAQFTFNGEDVVVIANHLNSKRGDNALFGKVQPPVLHSEDQRNELAKIVNNFVDNVHKDNSDANVVVLGDMNDFQFSKPLQLLQGDVLTNMINNVPAEERYSYVYQGNSQVLDHILVSNALAEHTAVDVIHVNADFTEMSGRASDHEPILIQTDLTK